MTFQAGRFRQGGMAAHHRPARSGSGGHPKSTRGAARAGV